MGIVVEAEDRELARVVAVKGLRDPARASVGGRERQAREARISARLTHPNIVPVFDVWTDSRGNPWCSMLRVPGEAPTLARRLAELQGRKTLEERLPGELFETFLQVCRAVSYAHGRGVLHRDLKPDNILLGPTGEALVADWGLAAAAGETATGVELVGTRGYAAPEQLGAFGEPRSDERSDVYSLGVILFEMLAGRRHAEALTWAAGWGGGPPRPQAIDLPSRFPRELADIIRRATAWLPEERLPDVASLRRAVESYLAGGLIEGLSYSPWERARKWSRGHPALAGVMATALLCSVLLLDKYDETRRALAQAHGNLALSHTGWAAEATKGGQPDLARLHAALALRELAQAPRGHALPSGAAYSSLARASSESRLLWATTLDGPAEVVQFSRDGKTLAAATRAVGCWAFELSSDRVLAHTSIAKEEVWGMSLAPERHLLATSGADRLVRLWEPATGRQRFAMAGHTEPLWSLDFAPDGKLLATGGHDRTIRLWDVAAGRQVALLQGHTGQIWHVAFSPDGTMLASGDTDRTVRVWDVAGRCQLHRFEGSRGSVLGLAFSPDGATLASGSDDRIVRLWAVKPGGRQASLAEVPGTGQCFAFSPDGRTLASGHSDYAVRVWDVATTRLRRTLLGHTNWLSMLEFAPDGRTLASASQDGSIRLWDVSEKDGAGPYGGHSAVVSRMALSPDGRRVVTLGQDRTARVWEFPSGRLTGTFPGFERQVQTVAFDDGGHPVAAGSAGDEVEWRSPDADGPSGHLQLRDGAAQSLEFSPGCRLLAVATTGGAVRLVEPRTGVEAGRLERSPPGTQCVAFSPDGRLLATGGTYRDVLLWDARSGKLLARGEGHRESVECLRFSPDGLTLASGSQDFTVRVFSVAGMSGRLAGKHTGHVWALAFSPDGRLLVSGGLDGRIRLWRMPDLETLMTLEPNASSVTSLLLSGDGKLLLSAGGQQPQLWDLRVADDPEGVAAEALVSSHFEIPDGQMVPRPKLAGSAPPPRGVAGEGER
jgi:WD40 repeat protein/tRNA A-37 threonylcarbamoyl transferase component Bud32